MRGSASAKKNSCRASLNSNSSDKHIAVGIAHGVLGELWQGPIDGAIAVISLPIERSSRATAVKTGRTTDPTKNMTPLRKAAFNIFAKSFPSPLFNNYKWDFDSQLATGQGMGSSTADIVALIRCLERIKKIRLTNQEIMSILEKIERSDPVFCPHTTLYKTSKHEIVEQFSDPLHLWSCFAITGTPVPTSGPLNRKIEKCYHRYQLQYKESLENITNGLRQSDLPSVFTEATKSAMLAQDYLENCFLEKLYKDHKSLGASAVSRAHTGSIISLLFDHPLETQERQFLSEYFSSHGHIAQFAKVGNHAF